VLLATWVAIAQQPRAVTDAVLRAAPGTGEEWLSYGHDLGEKRFSPLTQINASNVSRLGLAWSYDIPGTFGNPPGGGNQEATPLMWNGTIYGITTWSVVFAVDARTGKEKWTWDPQVNRPAVQPKVCCGIVNRGVAIYEGKIIAPIIDGRLVALDAMTGRPVWESRVAYPQDQYTLTMAPRIAKGKIIIGGSGSEYPVRGFIDGYSANAVDTFDVPTTGIEGAQLPTLFPEKVRQIDELTRATVNVQVEALDGTGVELHRTEPIWLLARTSAPFAVRDPSTGGWADLTKYFGAFVTPNAPKVMDFLPKIAAKKPNHEIAGYQKGPADVQALVEATYAALKAEGVQYINSTTAFGPDEGEIIQRVRLPSETLGSTGANCIDGTVLFASLLEAMTLNAAIITLPGHAVVAWQPDPAQDNWDYLDTVLIHDAEFAGANERGRAHAQPVEPLFAIAGSKYNRWSIRDLRAMGITPTY
jgi:hypothetical protein